MFNCVKFDLHAKGILFFEGVLKLVFYKKKFKIKIYRNIILPVVLYGCEALTFRNYVFCPQCNYMFCVDLRTNNDFFSVQQLLICFYNRGRECLLRGTYWAFKSDRYSFVLKGLNNDIQCFITVSWS
jgi:hypothetical protein